MKREILYRGKRVDNGEWVKGCLIKTGNFPEIRWQKMGAVGVIVDSQVDPETVGQYTGLKDKNGTKIFEEDKLHALRTKPSVYGEVVWCDAPDCRFGLKYNQNTSYSWSMGCSEWEIIGNVHDKEQP